MKTPKRAWRRCLIESLFIACMTTLTFSQASANDDGIIIIRCVGYEEPMVSFLESGKPGSYPRNDRPFDVHISPSRGIGWWSSSFIRIDEDRPATLLIDVDHYELTATGTKPPMTERVWLDRVAGTMRNFFAVEGTPTVELRRGGMCSKLQPKF
jgi:hypothetical protein